MISDFPVIDGELRLPDGLTYLKNQQFCSRDDIRRVVVPVGVGFMEEEVFAECPNLEEVVLPEGLINIGVAAFADCPRLRQINLPRSIKTIDDGAFIGCEALSDIALPDGLASIGSMAFQNAGLRQITVPASVTHIGEEAFFECPELVCADVLGEQAVIEKDAFGSNYQLVRGYIAPGYPAEHSPSAELLYTLLWCSCPDRHSPATSARAETFIRAQELLIMERILKANNVPALHTLVNRRLLDAGQIDTYLQQTLDAHQTELTALLLAAKRDAGSNEEEFDL